MCNQGSCNFYCCLTSPKSGNLTRWSMGPLPSSSVSNADIYPRWFEIVIEWVPKFWAVLATKYAFISWGPGSLLLNLGTKSGGWPAAAGRDHRVEEYNRVLASISRWKWFCWEQTGLGPPKQKLASAVCLQPRWRGVENYSCQLYCLRCLSVCL